MSDNQTGPREFDFALTLTGVHDLTSTVEDALFEAGCDDATLSIQHGNFTMDFCREAASLKEAIFSAIQDVRKANIGAAVQCVGESDRVASDEIIAAINNILKGVEQRGQNPELVAEFDQSVAKA